MALEMLDELKPYIERWTHEGQDYSHYEKPPLGRFYSLRYAFEYFVAMKGKTIVELGTLRSYVHGGHKGCNSSDDVLWDVTHPENWDWGSGCFSLLASLCLGEMGPHIHTVDISQEHIRRCRHMTQHLAKMFDYHVRDSIGFLQDFGQSIDLLYVDSGDMTPVEETAKHQLQEVHTVVTRGLMSKSGIIVIDDVRNTTPFKYGDTSGMGKAKLSIPFLEREGWKRYIDEYQVVMGR